MTFTVRRLEPGDAAAYRALRLESLADAPTAFGSDVGRESGFSDAVWAERMVANPNFGLFDGDELVGIATFLRGEGVKGRHRGDVVGVYVKPKARGTGASRLLLEALIAEVRDRVVQLHLAVTTNNAPARRLYERLGFQVYGTEPRAILVDGRYYDKYLMVLRLDEGGKKVTDNE